MAIGSFCLVLHGHLPYVLRHGEWPHGEDWLYEAAAETYLRILSMLGKCEFMNGNPRITIGLTPVLLEQLSHDDFKNGFDRYLSDRIERAGADKADFEKDQDTHFADLAENWVRFYTDLKKQFADINRDIPGAFAEFSRKGSVEILTSSATHAYLPLVYEDAGIFAQLRAGMASSERILGLRPGGLWLPECAYRPPGPWHPPVCWGDPRERQGIETFLNARDITHFFVEDSLIRNSRSEWVRNGEWKKIGWDEAPKYPDRGWNSVHEPFFVASDGTARGDTMVLARDPDVCEKVWSGDVGYPADGVYLEFHKKKGERRGLRYWKVTQSQSGLGEKDPYYPGDIQGKIHEHAKNFCDHVKQRLQHHHSRTGRYGVVTACFDAELFGHWWFEGPSFLRDVVLTLNADPDIDMNTTSEFLEQNPPDKAVSLPEGSWGDGGDHRVWTNDSVNWMWEMEYRCETLFGKLTFELPWEERDDIRKVLEKCGRELLLLQASDWPFVITRGQAVDYGIKRFTQHVSRFECLAEIAQRMADDSGYLNRLTEVQKFEMKDSDIHDVIFPHIDLNWWSTFD